MLRSEVQESTTSGSTSTVAGASPSPLATRNARNGGNEHFVFLLLPDFTHLAFSCAVEPLRVANRLSGQHLYSWSLASADGAPQTASTGTTTVVDHGLVPLRHNERLIVVSGINVQDHVAPQVIDYLHRERRHGVRIGAICSGAYVLARAGLLDGLDCAIHWAFHDWFSEAFPRVGLRRQVFVADQPILTASGGPAASDLMLHLISRSHGTALARLVADEMVYTGARNDAAEQRLAVSSRFGTRNAALIKALKIMESHTEDPVDVTFLAGQIGITVRQLQRLCRRHLGMTPWRVYTQIRLQKARSLLVQTDWPITQVALACGFGSPSNFSRSYRQQFGCSPRDVVPFN